MPVTAVRVKCGKDSLFKIGSTAMKNVRGINIDTTQSTVETTAHGASLKTYDTVIMDLKVTFKMLAFEGDTELPVIQTAFISKSPLEIDIADSITGFGPKGAVLVSKCSQTHNDDGAVEYDIEFVPAYATTEMTFNGRTA